MQRHGVAARESHHERPFRLRTRDVDCDITMANRAVSNLAELGGQRVEVILHVPDEQLVALDLAAEVRESEAEMKSTLRSARHRADPLERHEKPVHGREVRSQDLGDVGGGHLALRRPSTPRIWNALATDAFLGVRRGSAIRMPRGISSRAWPKRKFPLGPGGGDAVTCISIEQVRVRELMDCDGRTCRSLVRKVLAVHFVVAREVVHAQRGRC